MDVGTYLNPGKQSYQMAVNSEIYVDKYGNDRPGKAQTTPPLVMTQQI
jgi:hypothetical protein